LSVAIATLASYAALDLAGRVTAAGGAVRMAWLSGGACAMGWASGPCTTSACLPAAFRLRLAMTGRGSPVVSVVRHSSLWHGLVRGEPPAHDAGGCHARQPGYGRWDRCHALHRNVGHAAALQSAGISFPLVAFRLSWRYSFRWLRCGLVSLFGRIGRSEAQRKIASAVVMGAAISDYALHRDGSSDVLSLAHASQT